MEADDCFSQQLRGRLTISTHRFDSTQPPPLPPPSMLSIRLPFLSFPPGVQCVANSIADRDAWLDIIEATKMGSRREWARAVGGGLPALSGMDDAFGGGSSAASTSTAGPSEAVAAATAAEAAADGFEFVEREVEHHPALLNPYSYFVLI